jgi:hypothetical protein
MSAVDGSIMESREEHVMAPRTIEVTPTELATRRADVLEKLGMTREQFRERVREGSLSPSEWEARSELEQIAFLLGDSSDDL